MPWEGGHGPVNSHDLGRCVSSAGHGLRAPNNPILLIRSASANRSASEWFGSGLKSSRSLRAMPVTFFVPSLLVQSG